MIAAAIDCPPAGEAGFDGFVEFLVAMMFFDFTRDERARTNDGELTNENIDKLRHLIDGRFAKEATNFGDTGVVFNFVIFEPLLFILRVFEQFVKFFVGIDDHGAEFEHFERLTVAADASLRINNPVKITGAKIGKADKNIERNQKDEADEAE